MTYYDVVLMRRRPASSGAPALIDVGPIKWTSLTGTRIVGEPGQVTVATTVDALSQPVKDALRDLSVSPCELWIWRDAVHIHAGPVTDYRIDGRQLTLVAPGLLAYVAYMIRDTDYTATATEQATIVTALIDGHQAQTYGHFGIDTASVTATGVTRDLALVGAELHPILDVLYEMGRRDNGFELTVDPATRRLELDYPRRGSDRSATVIIDRRSIGVPSYAQSVGPGQFASDVVVTATSTDGVNLTASVADTGVRTSFGRTMLSGSFQDVSAQATLNEHAARLLADVNTPQHTIAPELLPVSGFGYGDVTVGDIVTYEYDAGLGLQTFTPRVRAITLSMNAGTERIHLELV